MKGQLGVVNPAGTLAPAGFKGQIRFFGPVPNPLRQFPGRKWRSFDDGPVHQLFFFFSSKPCT